MGVGVSLTPRPPLPSGKTRYPFYRRLGGSQDRSGRVENLVPNGVRFRNVQPVVSRYTGSLLCNLKFILSIIDSSLALLPNVTNQVTPMIEVFAVLGCGVAWVDSCLSTFLDNILVPFPWSSNLSKFIVLQTYTEHYERRPKLHRSRGLKSRIIILSQPVVHLLSCSLIIGTMNQKLNSLLMFRVKLFVQHP